MFKKTEGQESPSDDWFHTFLLPGRNTVCIVAIFITTVTGLCMPFEKTTGNEDYSVLTLKPLIDICVAAHVTNTANNAPINVKPQRRVA